MLTKLLGLTAWERLMARTRRRADTGCLEYVGAKNRKGYGWISYQGRPALAHRLAYQLAHGVALADDALVLHSCDNRACVNPDHLRVGTPADNSRDMVDRDRSGRGERASRAKLTEAGVLHAFARYAAGDPVAQIARDLGTSTAAIVDAVAGRTWRHLRHLAPARRRPGIGGRRPSRHAA